MTKFLQWLSKQSTFVVFCVGMVITTILSIIIFGLFGLLLLLVLPFETCLLFMGVATVFCIPLNCHHSWRLSSVCDHYNYCLICINVERYLL